MAIDPEQLQRILTSKFALVAAAFAFFFVAERFSSLRRRRCDASQRLTVNLALAAIALAVTFLVARKLNYIRLQYDTLGQWGLLTLFRENVLGVEVVWGRTKGAVSREAAIGMFVVGLALFDLTYYYWHRLLHAVPMLWRFHNVHHTDLDMDVSTAARFHVGELLIGDFFAVVQAGLIGLDGWAFTASYVTFRVCMLFHHSNTRLPYWFERIIGMLIVTPRMHGIHHSVVKSETNSNYAVVFRIWDRLHGTLRLNVPQDEITIGVAGYQNPADNSIEPLMVLPFTRQRDYWRMPDGDWPQRREGPEKRRHVMLP